MVSPAALVAPVHMSMKQVQCKPPIDHNMLLHYECFLLHAVAYYLYM